MDANPVTFLMSENPHYSRAPITEALIDIRVNTGGKATLDDLAKVHASIDAEYPTRRNQVVVEGQMTAGAQVTAAARQTHIGYTCLNSDERQIVQVRLDGFTFSRLAPYDRWETFREEARRLWDIYRTAVKLTGIIRLAVRYINRLDLPAPTELGDYLRTYPEIAPDLPQLLGGYFMQVNLPLPDLPGTLLITQAISPPPAPELSSVILDIDIFRDTGLPQNEDEVWAFFELLRQRKNQVFHACITDRTKELIS